MYFEKMFTWIISIVIASAAIGKIDTLQRWIWTAQAKVIKESKTSNWGSPRFFPERPFASSNLNLNKPRKEISQLRQNNNLNQFTKEVFYEE